MGVDKGVLYTHELGCCPPWLNPACNDVALWPLLDHQVHSLFTASYLRLEARGVAGRELHACKTNSDKICNNRG
jgi:hypothetical protein